ncbi:p53-like transcription factor [Eremomyces bilateralis CBS 781.70]|uniref:p53-like transcription factor n=1 Tax=Eremomyces bilateralis CBS 781.70 TaxID=1392243 RepID=A0A6G1G418_9PEZI|nr:p53-like transcription factor [Eremomyces bilateralis CBS 781.70]KAF1812837.1 p53-like transcription factor [Eremomyces bilateralis CBS 781.70]
MSYLAAPMSMPNVNPVDPLHVPLLPSDEGVFSQSMGSHAALKRFPNGFDDPFSDAMSGYEPPVQADQANGPESPSIEQGHKLLSFSLPTYNCGVLDYTCRGMTMNMSAQLHGMFFLAESPWAQPGEAGPQPTELTCYRRNLFQITGSITLPRGLRYAVTEQGERVQIIGQELSVSATESVEGNPVKIISVPWKTPASANPSVVEDKTEKEPQSIPLDLMAGQEIDADFVSFPIAWKRLQFRIATANNGRRKELQQHFVVHLKVIATLSTGARISLCEVRSGAIIVRGRSPRNFQSRKDFPIGTSAAASAARKAHSQAGAASSSHHQQPSHADTVESTGSITSTQQHQPTHTRPPNHLSLPQNQNPSLPFQYDPNGTPNLQITPEFFEWKTMLASSGGAMTALPPDVPAFCHHNAEAVYARSSPDLLRYNLPRGMSHLNTPIKLSLDDEADGATDGRSTSIKSPLNLSSGVLKQQLHSQHHSQAQMQANIHTTSGQKPPKLARAPSFSLNHLSSPDESADLLYEYFPLGLDDWMPPVDAVYRPHVVHHTNLPPEMKTVGRSVRSKRYFSEDVAS